MERDAIRLLYEWKARANRKPLIIRGARQVGKTWLMMEFARKAYDKWRIEKSTNHGKIFPQITEK